MNKRYARSDWILALLMLAPAATAQELQPLEGIGRLAEAFVAAQPGVAGKDHVTHVTAEGLDPRLKLPRCSTEPAATLPPGARIAARMTVGVGCAQPRWTLYVAVRVETELDVLVSRKAAPRGSALVAGDVEKRRMRVPGFASSYVSDVAELAGRNLRQPVAPGTPLTAELLAADILVRRGQRVTLVANAGGVEVRAQGEAIGDASPAGRVRVLNLSSRRIIEGQVESRDRVRVSL